MANEIVKWRDGHVNRAVSLDKMLNLFEDYGAEGLTTAEISTRMGSKNVASRILTKFPALKAAYQRGIDGRTIDGEAALLKRVKGFSTTVKSVSRKLVNGSVVEEFEKEEEVYFPPDVGALRLFLKGRENSRYSGDEDKVVGITINLDKTDSAL